MHQNVLQSQNTNVVPVVIISIIKAVRNPNHNLYECKDNIQHNPGVNTSATILTRD